MNYREAQIKFKEIFNLELDDWWYKFPNVDLGFDLIKFDEEFLKTPDGISTAQFLDKNYSVDARKFIQKLIGIKR